MDAERSPRTTRDALTLELLGDLGRIDDKVTALEHRIDALPNAFKEAIAPSLGAVALATKEAKGAIQQAGEAEVTAFKTFTAQDKVALRDSLKAALREEAGGVLADAARELETSARIHNEAARAERRQRWQWAALALAVGLMAGALGFYGSHLLYGKQQAEQAAFGRAVMSAWGDLDGKAKERIQAAQRQNP